MSRDFKIVVLGAGGVGKSCLTVQFVQGIFVEKYDPTIEDSYRKLVEVDNESYMLEILDTAGTIYCYARLVRYSIGEVIAISHNQFRYMKNGQGFVLVYSIIAQSTFNDLPELRDQILRVKDTDKVPMILVGNKCDLADQRVITSDQGEQLAKRFDCKFLEASAKTKQHVDNIFYDLIRQINLLAPQGKSFNSGKKVRGGCVLL